MCINHRFDASNPNWGEAPDPADVAEYRQNLTRLMHVRLQAAEDLPEAVAGPLPGAQVIILPAVWRLDAEAYCLRCHRRAWHSYLTEAESIVSDTHDGYLDSGLDPAQAVEALRLECDLAGVELDSYFWACLAQ